MNLSWIVGVDAVPKGLMWGCAAALALVTTAVSYAGSEKDDGHLHHHHDFERQASDSLESISDGADPHAHHRRFMLESKPYSRSLHRYELPDLQLVSMAGERTSLGSELGLDQPVMLNFIFTTCTTICPVLSATFSQVERQLGAERDEVRMISITIDPEYDTPARLRAYAARYDAGSQWQFLTGKLEDIVAIQKAFDAYRGTKMNHEPLTFLRASAGSTWLRLDGLASAADVVREYRQLIAEQDRLP